MNESAIDLVCNESLSESSSGDNGECVSADDGSRLGHILAIWLIYGPIVLVTILGNFIVIMAFVREPAIRCRVANCFILSLSVADFSVGVSLILNFVWLLEDEWVLGQVPCMIWLSADYCLSYASVLAIILISLDRYRLVTLKLRYSVVQTRRRAILSICASWAFCLTFYPALVFLWGPLTGEYIIEYSWDCDLESRENLYLNVFLIFLEFVVPLIVLAYLNTKLYLVIRKRAKGLVRTSNTPVPSVSEDASTASWKSRHDLASGVFYITGRAPGTVSLTSLTISVLDEDGTNAHADAVGAAGSSARPSTKPRPSHRRRLTDSNRPPGSSSTFRRYREFKKHRKAAVTLSILVGVYVLCWLPFYIKNTVNAFCDDCIHYYVLEVFDNLLWCNSTLNPFLYALLNIQYRRYIAGVLRRFCCWCTNK